MLQVELIFGWVDRDQMRAHGRADHGIRRLRDDCLCLLKRHMTIDTVGLNLPSECFRHAAARRLMAPKALGGVSCSRALGRVGLMAGRASHSLRRPETAASLEQAHLIGVYVGTYCRLCVQRAKVFIQRSSGNVGKCRRKSFLLGSGVAECTQVNLSFARKCGWVQDV